MATTDSMIYDRYSNPLTRPNEVADFFEHEGMPYVNTMGSLFDAIHKLESDETLKSLARHGKNRCDEAHNDMDVDRERLRLQGRGFADSLQCEGAHNIVAIKALFGAVGELSRNTIVKGLSEDGVHIAEITENDATVACERLRDGQPH